MYRYYTLLCYRPKMHLLAQVYKVKLDIGVTTECILPIGYKVLLPSIPKLRYLRAVFHKTVRVCLVYCNFKMSFTCRITVIFGTLKDGSLLINTLASNICFSYRNMFQNGVDALSNIVDAFLSKSSKFYLVWIIRYYSKNYGSLTHETRIKDAVNMKDLICLQATVRTLKNLKLFSIRAKELFEPIQFCGKKSARWVFALFESISYKKPIFE